MESTLWPEGYENDWTPPPCKPRTWLVGWTQNRSSFINLSEKAPCVKEISYWHRFWFVKSCIRAEADSITIISLQYRQRHFLSQFLKFASYCCLSQKTSTFSWNLRLNLAPQPVVLHFVFFISTTPSGTLFLKESFYICPADVQFGLKILHFV